MAEARLVDAGDGHKARVAALWSEEKLGILSGYLRQFARVCKGKAPWYALDLFAGGGYDYAESREEVIPGSPLIALTAGPPDAPGATEVVMAEKNDQAFRALESRTRAFGDRARLFHGDSNLLIAEMLESIPRQAPSFAFLDPEGSELDWRTVEAVADHKRGYSRTKIEQLILFSDAGVSRLAGEFPEYVTRVFGHEAWTEIRDRRERQELTAEEARTAYVQMYAEGLKRDLGYENVIERQIQTPRGLPMCFLIFASDHHAGHDIMDNRFDRVRLDDQVARGQGTIFQLPAAPRRRRLPG